MSERTPACQHDQNPLIVIASDIAVIKRDVQYMVEESKSHRNAIEDIKARVTNIENERRTEKGIVDGRKQMAFWIWSGITVIAGSIGGMCALAIETWLRLFSHP
jgi:GTP:adenosylcobinamide-phosphate guanylyltransferase